MRHFIFSSKQAILSSLILGMFLLFSPLSDVYAKAGCCSKHGGVSGCNNATGYQMCKDGSTSPSCACNGTTNTTKTKAMKTTKATTNNGATTATTAAATTTATTTTAATTNSKTKTTGCCSRHGGVAKCDTKTGYQICKDGSHSTTCACSKK